MKSAIVPTSFSAASSLPPLLLAAGLLLLQGATSTADQSVAENLAPIAKLCLAGGDCVGGSAAASQVQPESAPAVDTTPIAEAAPEPAAAPEPEAAPPQIAQADDGFDLQATYQLYCFACHSTGLSGAPRPGDAEAWAPRMEKGRDEIVAIMNRGLNAMPPKGLCMTCTDDQLWELSQYMVDLEQ